MFLRNCLLIIALSLVTYNSHAQLQTANALPAIGQWREHLPYGSAIRLAKTSSGIFTATPYSLFHYNFSSSEISRYSRVTGLAETGVSTLKVSETGNRLLIAYSNGNIDILEPGKITNIPDIKRKNIAGDKSIYDIHFNNNLAYLSTGFGIVVIDMGRNEVKDSYLIGPGGQQSRINSITTDATSVYAATDDGILKASLNSDLRNFNSWQKLAGITGVIRSIKSFNNKLIALNNNNMMMLNGSTWSNFYSSARSINSISISENKLLICETDALSQGRITVLKTDGSTETTLQSPILQNPVDAIISENNYYIADRFSGLIKMSGNSYERVIPNSPFEKASGEMIFHNGKLIVAAGEVNSSWIYTYNRFGLYKFQNNTWSYVNQYNNAALDSVYDVITVAGDAAGTDIYYGSYSGGLVKLDAANHITIFKQNSPVSAAVGDPASYRVSGLAFDQQHNLWISNYGAVTNLLVKKADNSWKAFTVPFAISENAVSQVTIDDAGRKWIVSPKGNGLVCFDDRGTIDNTSDDKWRLFRIGAGNGNLPDNEVYCSVKDKNGSVWVGTAKGIAVISCDDPFTNNCQAVQPIVQQGNFAGPLFGNEAVKTITVDGANRKWVGTKNGLWLVSTEGEKVISHFTEDNSPLLSSNILQLAIDPASGEVFIATSKGICSFRGTATESTGVSKDDVLVFPNPVPPSFTGMIAIKGLPVDATVKITELNGRLVYETRSNGGQAVWNGKDYRGRQLSSGTYLVMIRSKDGQEKLATKIFIVK